MRVELYTLPKALVKELLEAALDQPEPTDALKQATQACARYIRHPDHLRGS